MALVLACLRTGRRASIVLGTCLCLGLGVANAQAVGFLIPDAGGMTGQKPQSKLWFNDGTWWGILNKVGRGLHFWEFDGLTWRASTFLDAELGSNGEADVKWNGTELYVLAYTASPHLYAYRYDRALRVFNLQPGFPVALPIAINSETMVLDQDSTGRLWATYEGAHGDVYVCWSTSDDHRQWNAPGMVIRSGIADDDISSVVAFDRKIGVFWSDQVRWEFGFRVHRDEDPPEIWQAVETVVSGDGVSDDHINLKADGQGTVYAVTKDINNKFRLHFRPAATGKWSTKTGVISGIGTRPMLELSDQDKAIYVAYTNWSSSALDVNLRQASYGKYTFANLMTPLVNGPSLNNCTGTKQVLPAGCFMMACEGAGHTYWNGWGTLPADGPAPPPAPLDVHVDVVAKNASGSTWSPASVIQIAWTSPAPAQRLTYSVYRRTNNGARLRLGTALAASPFVDPNPIDGSLCYTVTAADSTGRESSPSASKCIVWSLNGAPMPDLAKSHSEITGGVALRAWPNPFNPQTRLEFDLPLSSPVRLAVFDVAGREVALLQAGDLPLGKHIFDWTAANAYGRLPSGVYFARLDACGQSVRTKLLLVQ